MTSAAFMAAATTAGGHCRVLRNGHGGHDGFGACAAGGQREGFTELEPAAIGYHQHLIAFFDFGYILHQSFNGMHDLEQIHNPPPLDF
jgi:hypothetical protein